MVRRKMGLRAMGEYPCDSLGPEAKASRSVLRDTTLDRGFTFQGAPLDNSLALHRRLQQFGVHKTELVARAERLLAVKRQDYERMSELEQKRFNEDRLRLASQDVVVPTRNTREVTTITGQLVKRAEYANKDQQTGVVIQGPAGVGKTTAIINTLNELASQHYGAFHEEWWRLPPHALKRDSTNAVGDRVAAQSVFSVPIILNSNPTPRSISEALLASLAAITQDTDSGESTGRAEVSQEGHGGLRPSSKEQVLTNTLVKRLTAHGVRVVVIDEIHFVRGDKAGDHVVNCLKSLINRTRVVLLMAGVRGANGLEFILRRATEHPTREQLRRRLVVLDFEPFEMAVPDVDGDVVANQEWAAVVRLMTLRLILLDQDPQWWVEESTLKYLWMRTQGVFTSLNSLLMEAAHVAIGGAERLDIKDLEKIRISEEADSKAAKEYRIGPKFRRGAGKKKLRAHHGPDVSSEGKKAASDLGRRGVVSERFVINPESGLVEQ